MRLVAIVRDVVRDRAIPDELEPALADHLARAIAAWPRLAPDDDRFIRAIAARLPDGDALAGLAALHTDDLYLAIACADGDPAALAGFEDRCAPAIARALASAGTPPAQRADLGQVIRQRLLVATGGPPRIATYAARGALPAWVRVIATREAARIAAPRADGDGDELAALAGHDDDPETAYLKRVYRAEFKHALQAAIEGLDDRDRLLLRQHALDGLGIDQLASLHGVHRATAARWLEAARAAVMSATQRTLIIRLRIGAVELASLLQLIRSQLDVSLSRLLAS